MVVINTPIETVIVPLQESQVRMSDIDISVFSSIYSKKALKKALKKKRILLNNRYLVLGRSVNGI